MTPLSTLLDQRKAPAELEPVVKRAKEGEAAARWELRRALENDPALFVAVGRGDLAELARDVLIGSFTGGGDGKKNLLVAHAVKAKAAMLREELGGVSPSAVERLLVDRVVFAWIDLHWLDAAVSLAVSKNRGETHVNALDRRRTRAHNR